MRRGRVLLTMLALLAPAPAAQAQSWADPQIQTVVAQGLMASSTAEFRAEDGLTRRELGEVLAALTQQAQVVEEPNRLVTVVEFDAALVNALGLAEAAQQIRATLSAAGLQPPGRLGTEAVARLLRLRYNHPAAKDFRELLPTDPITRAEAAFSVARFLELEEWDVLLARETAASFVLPELTAWQRRVLRRAAKFVGYPYIWGGTSERAQTFSGVPSRGGFDCSGFVWRVYKLERFRAPGGAALLGVLRGRTTYQMSGEVARRKRVAFERLAPADVVFFGDRGPASRPAQVGHMGMYLGGGWFIHSSGQGVTLLPLTNWYSETFAWARRPLREAGLS
ncbi:MAG: C40 family peptidase [Gaiellaceae bacterium]